MTVKTTTHQWIRLEIFDVLCISSKSVKKWCWCCWTNISLRWFEVINWIEIFSGNRRPILIAWKTFHAKENGYSKSNFCSFNAGVCDNKNLFALTLLANCADGKLFTHSSDDSMDSVNMKTILMHWVWKMLINVSLIR